MQGKAILGIFLGLIILLLSCPVVQAGDWEKLGEWNVKRKKKAAEISVTTESPHKEIKLSVGGIGVYLRKVTVYFANGEEHFVEINSAISPGGDTQTILLPENGQTIQKVRFGYNANKRSIVTLWGKRAIDHSGAASSEEKSSESVGPESVEPDGMEKTDETD